METKNFIDFYFILVFGEYKILICTNSFIEYNYHHHSNINYIKLINVKNEYSSVVLVCLNGTNFILGS